MFPQSALSSSTSVILSLVEEATNTAACFPGSGGSGGQRVPPTAPSSAGSPPHGPSSESQQLRSPSAASSSDQSCAAAAPTDVRVDVIAQSWRIVRLQPQFASRIKLLQVFFKVSPHVPSTVTVADVNRLRVVCVHILSNAIQRASPGGTVRW